MQSVIAQKQQALTQQIIDHTAYSPNTGYYNCA